MSKLTDAVAESIAPDVNLLLAMVGGLAPEPNIIVNALKLEMTLRIAQTAIAVTLANMEEY